MVSLPVDFTKFINQNPYFLAPMAGVTDKPFRSFMKEMGCGMITTELISARSLQEGNSKSLQLLEFDESQRPLGVQIFGENPESIQVAVQKINDHNPPDFIDLNLGCPVKKIVKKGAGSALLKDLKALQKILQIMKKHSAIPVSLKVRTGWTQENRNADQVAHIAYNEGFSWMTIHGRTRAQGYCGKADWNYIKEIKSKSPLPIIGNGDITSAQKAVEALTFSQCDGIMIGRGCLNNPWIFKESLNLLHQEEQSIEKNYYQILLKLIQHLENFYNESIFLLQTKKFSSWFSSGFPKSTEFRKKLFQEKNKNILLEMIQEFFQQNKEFQKKEPEYEPFLMQGHG